MGDGERDEMDDLLEDDVGDDDMEKAKPSGHLAEIKCPKCGGFWHDEKNNVSREELCNACKGIIPAPPTKEEIRAAIKSILAHARRTIQETTSLSTDDGTIVDRLFEMYESDAVLNKLVASGRPLKEITDSLQEELDASIETFKVMANATAPIAPAPPLPPPPTPPVPSVAPPTPLSTFRPKGGSFFDVEEKSTTNAAAEPACVTCGKVGTTVPLLFLAGKFYCLEHSKTAGVTVSVAPSAAAPTAPPVAPAPAPEPPKIWHIHSLTPYDAIRKRLDGSNNLLQIIAGEGEDEVQMHAKDRIVVMLVKADGSRHKVLDKKMGGAFLYLFHYTLSSWGNSTLMPHMTQQRGLTPPGYG